MDQVASGIEAYFLLESVADTENIDCDINRWPLATRRLIAHGIEQVTIWEGGMEYLVGDEHELKLQATCWC